MFELKELKAANGRAKLAKAADETGLTAALLGYMPDDICNDLLHMFNHMLFPGGVRAISRKTLFKMLPKTSKPRTTTDFRPIASMRLSYKMFACMIFGPIEDTLEANQPEEQHGFRSKRSIEEPLLAFQRDLGQNPGDGPAIVDRQRWSFKSLRPGQLGITLESGG